MVLVPGGTDVVGSAGWYVEEAPPRPAEVGDVWFDQHPVTNAEFARFVEETEHVTVAEVAPDPADFPGADPALLVPGSQVFTPTDGPVHLGDWTRWWRWQPGASWRAPEGPGSTWADRGDHPVVHVGWEDATAYAAWAGKELATEAEWERAARGGLAGRDYAWGDELHPGGARLANTWIGPFPWRSDDPDGHHRTSPVGSYPGNGYGLADMIGNVWEWTSTRWTDDHGSGPSPCCGGGSPLVETDRFVTKAAHTSARRTTASATGRRPGRATASGTRRLTSGSGVSCGPDRRRGDGAAGAPAGHHSRPAPARARSPSRGSAG